jgi:thiol-disulfide isomerase/thioredoxin
MKLSRAVPAFLVVWAAAVPVLGQNAPLREGAGQRLAELDKMELTAFPASNWSLLSDWANGDALTPAATDGNVVLIVTWANWNAASTRVFPVVQRLASENESKGLVVVGVHHNDGWEGATDAAQKAGLTFRYAHDVNNAFHAALKVDSDPDFYLIDRAGQLRYADIQTASVISAVNELVAETREQASDLPALLQKKRAEQEAASKRTGVIRQGFDLATLPEMNVPKQPADAYTKAEWPEHFKEFESGVLQFQQNNFGGQAEIKVLELPKAASGVRWFDSPPPLNGRAIVVYFWSPDFYESYHDTQPKMDNLQKEKGHDVAVIGIVIPRRADQNVFAVPSAEDNEKARNKFLEMVETARTRRHYDHANVVDPDRTVLQTILGSNNTTQATPAPLAAIFSSDLTLRWIGPPTDSRFDTSLEQVLRVDPAVQKRRELEQEYIKAHGQ